MKIEKTYIIDNWSNWNNCVFNALNDFFDTFKVMPEILSANKHTLSQIDFMVNIIPRARKNVFSKHDITGIKHSVSDDEDIKIASYACLNCEVIFCYDSTANDKTFSLIYDSETEFEESIEITPTPEFELSHLLTKS